MPKITSIHRQKKNLNRYSIFVDEAFYTGIDENSLVRLGLRKGLELNESELKNLKDESLFGFIYTKVLEYIARRPRSTREVIQYVSKKLYEKEVFLNPFEQDQKSEFITRIINELTEHSYLDDDEFVRWWIKERTQAQKPMGFDRVFRELMQKGVQAEIVKKIWNEEIPSDLELVSTVAKKIMSRYDLHDSRQKTRFVNYLRRRGFSWEAIKTVLQ